ncbi:MAG: hypothetical protein BWY79_01725 [Actinobacteria bacterium ADurb.Bin444]|nr:MAG: hypothetical protein BWY79_01725 [Actinobacteria bacterium ADurb.Bin444]
MGGHGTKQIHLFVRSADRATDSIAVSADVLRKRLDHEIGPQLYRLERNGGGEGGVHCHQRTGLMGQGGDGGDVC